MRFSNIAFAFAAVVAPMSLASAQPRATLPVSPGARVRVSAPSLVSPVVANFLEVRGDTVILMDDNAGRGVWQIPASSVTKVEVYRGKKLGGSRLFWPMVGVGAGVGALFTGVFTKNNKPDDTTQQYNLFGSVLIGAAGGAAVGALVGYLIPTDNWESVGTPRLSVVPGVRGASVGLAFRF